MRRLTLLLTLFTFMFSCPAAAEEVSLTLDEAIAIAMRDNRDVLLKALDIEKAKDKIAQANAALFPTLNLTGTLSNTRGLYSKDSSQATSQLTLKQYLYKGGETINTIEQNKAKLRVSGSLLDKTKLDLVLSVKKAFYTLLLAGEFFEINKNILENTRAHLAFIRERYKSGQASESEVLNMETSLSNVWQAYEASLNQVLSSQALLNSLLYLDKDTRVTPSAQFTYEPVEVAYDEAFLKAMQTRPEIRQYEAQAEADEKAVQIARADNQPDIYASWDYYSRTHTSGTTNRNWNDYNVIGLTFSWPIFDGWATKAKVEQAIVDLEATQLLKVKTSHDIALELKNAYLDLKNSVNKIKSFEAQVNLYKDTLSVVEERYRAGQVSSLALDDASLGYQISLFNQKQSTYDYIIAKAAFEKAGGPALP